MDYQAITLSLPTMQLLIMLPGYEPIRIKK